VEFSSLDSIAILSFSEEHRFPRLSRAILNELREQLRAINSAIGFEGIVIASNSRSFPSGAELDEVAALSGVPAFEFARLGQALLREIETSRLPVVAAVRGYCLGGGLDLALACHGCVAAYDSSFGHPGAALGLMTGWGGTRRLAQRLNRAAALQMLTTSERIPAAQALSLGLVDALAPSADLILVAAEKCPKIGHWSRGSRNQISG
jgi:enoyl-CoA hydratase